MSEDRKKDQRLGIGEDPRGGGASRARNRTVLLSPETIGQVRANLADDEDSAAGAPDPLNELLPPIGAGWDGARDGIGSGRPQGREPDPIETQEGASSFGARFGEPQAPAGDAGTRRPVARFTPQPVGNSSWGAGSPQTHSQQTPTAAPQMRQTKPPTGSAVRPNPAAQSEHGNFVPPVQAKQPPRSKIVGFLISYDVEEFGEVHEIRAGRWLVTSRPTDHQDYVLINDETVSPLHAIIRATAEGKVQILDQLSEFGTGVTRVGAEAEEEVAGTMATVSHGDTIRFGKRKFTICLVP